MAGIEHIAEVAGVLLLAVLGRGLAVLIWPYKDCGWCKNRKEHPRPWNRGRCWFCHGSRLRRRLGAGLVHKVKLSLIQAWNERGPD